MVGRPTTLGSSPAKAATRKAGRNSRRACAAHLKETLFHPVTMTKNGKRRRVPYIRAFMEGLAHMAVDGDPRARRDLLGLIHRHPRAVKHQEPIRIIDDSMSTAEAAAAYAATLTAIAGMVEPDEE